MGKAGWAVTGQFTTLQSCQIDLGQHRLALLQQQQRQVLALLQKARLLQQQQMHP
jgi:hypothetical protein